MKLPPFDQIQIFLQVFISVVTFIIYLLNTLYFMMKYIWNTAEIRLHMDKSNVYFSNEKINYEKRSMECKQKQLGV